jgi:adenylate kinase family enzyme
MTPDSAALETVHIVGLAGSGKTTLARWFAAQFGLTAHDLDWVVYTEHRERSIAEITSGIEAILREGRWATEGAYGEPWLVPLLVGADLIAWLDVGVATCLARMVKRHVRAELSRTNQHPGWLRLVRFMNYTRESAREQRRRTEELLDPYRAKVRRCRTSAEVRLMKEQLLRQAAKRADDPHGGTTTSSSPS